MNNHVLKSLYVMGILGIFLITTPCQTHAASIKNNIVLKMNFEDDLNDDSKQNNDGGILHGVHPPVYVEGIYETKCLSFNGEDDSFVMIPDANSLDFGTGDFSISVWLKTANGEGTFIQKMIGYAGYNLSVGSGKLELWLKDENGNKGEFYPANKVNADGSFYPPRINDNQWHHVVITVDRDQPDGVIFYIDKMRIPYTMCDTHNTKITEVNGSLSNADPLYLGCHHYKNGWDYKGEMDSLIFINRVVTADEVTGLYYLPSLE